jgi:hypothetical protein
MGIVLSGEATKDRQQVMTFPQAASLLFRQIVYERILLN